MKGKRSLTDTEAQEQRLLPVSKRIENISFAKRRLNTLRLQRSALTKQQGRGICFRLSAVAPMIYNAEAHGRAVARTVQPLVGSLDSEI